MKYKYRISLIFLLVSTLIKVNAAIDGDIQAKGGLALKQYAMVLKHRPLPLAHHIALTGSDTDLLLKAVAENSNAKYVTFAKAGIIANLDAFLKLQIPRPINVSVFSGAMARKNAGDGPTTPADRTLSAFIVALTDIINGVASAAVVPPSLSFASLNATKKAINTEIATAVDNWIKVT